MKFFNKLSLTNKIIVIILTVTGFVVLFNFILGIIFTIESKKEQMKINLNIQAHLVSEHCQAPLMFEDMEALKRNLNILSQTPDISDAYVYNSNGELLASYRNDEIKTSVFARKSAALNEFNDGFLVIKKSIKGGQNRDVQLYIRASTKSLEKNIRDFFFWGAATFVLSIFLAYFLARRLQASVSKPILNLAGIIRRISTSKDFSIRVNEQNEDEVGLLYDGFNDMLEQIQNHDQQRNRAEVVLKANEEKYRSLIEQSGDAIYLLYNRRFEIINKKFQEIFGLTLEDVNKPGFDFINLVSPESRAYIEDRLKRSAAGEELEPKYEFTALGANGNEIIVETSVTYIKYGDGIASQGIIRDITERKRLEEQLRQAQKMESIGTLAGGVAHDFNNLLTVINGYSEMTLLRMDKENPLHSTLTSILQAGKRAENLTSQLLAFSRKQIYKAEILGINSVITSIDKMLRRLIGEDIIIETGFTENLPKIKADRSQLEQIFVNLIVNARGALLEVNKPSIQKKITIKTGSVFLDSQYVSKHPGSATGQHIFFAVSDNGSGMDADTKQKIFEPFFTTKGQGKGTGLGLSMVYGIVKQNNGSVYVYSEPGEGTTFKIYWPVTSEESVISKAPVSAEILAGSETILIVEDETEVCRFAADSLTSLGYTIHTANNGKLALDLIKEKNPKLDLIITDLVMPKLNGKEFIEQAKKIYSDVKVIFVSGYTDNHIVHNGLLEEGVNFVQKPYSLGILSSTVRQVLDGK